VCFVFKNLNNVVQSDRCAPAVEPLVSYFEPRVRLASVPERGMGVLASLLNSALRAFVEDAVLEVLEVHGVEPDLDGLCLRVLLQPRCAGVYFCQASALERMRRARPLLRAALAAALGVDSAPELLFEVRSWIEV